MEVDSGNPYDYYAPQKDTVYAYLYDSAVNRYAKKYQYHIERTPSTFLIPESIEGATERIEFRSGTLLLRSGDYRFRYKQQLIEEINIYDTRKNELLKRFGFRYVPIKSNEEEYQYNNIYLQSCYTFYNGRTIPKEPLVFEYYGVDLNAQRAILTDRIATKMDQFGYPNEVCCTGNPYPVNDIPIEEEPFKAYLYPSLTNASRIRSFPINNYFGPVAEAYGKNTNVSPLLTMGSLKELKLSSGGVYRIFYEANMYYDSEAQASFYGGGIRVARLEMHDGNDYSRDMVKTYDYRGLSGNSSGILLYKPERTAALHIYKRSHDGKVFYANDITEEGKPVPFLKELSAEERIKRLAFSSNVDFNADTFVGYTVGYSRVVVNQEGAGKTAFEFEMPAAYGVINSGDWAAAKARFARFGPVGASTPVEYGDLSTLQSYYSFPFAPNPSQDYLMGQIKTVTMYNDNEEVVEEKIYNYEPVQIPLKVYALKIEKVLNPIRYGSAFTENIPVKSYVPMFIYSRYEIPLLATKRLTSLVTTRHGLGNLSSSLTEVENYEYGSTHHPYITKVSTTNSKGQQMYTVYKYVQDYSISGTWTNQDGAIKGMRKMLDKNILNIPIETYSVKTEGAEEILIGGSMSIYKYLPDRDLVVTDRVYTLLAGFDKSSFSESSIQSASGNYTLHFDNGAYQDFHEFKDHSKKGRAQTECDNKTLKNAAIFDAHGVAPFVVVQNAEASTIAFSDFDEPSEVDWNYSQDLVDGRLDSNGLQVCTNQATCPFTKTLKRGMAADAVFSCFINSQSAGILTITVTDGINPPVSGTIDYVAATGIYRFYKVKILVGDLGEDITVSISTNNTLKIDEAAFYPGNADMKYFQYGKGYAKLTETTSLGLTTKFSYHHDLRFGSHLIREIRDMDDNILQSHGYSDNEFNLPEGPLMFDIDADTVYEDDIVQLSVVQGKETGAEYFWRARPRSQYLPEPFLYDTANMYRGADKLTFQVHNMEDYFVNLVKFHNNILTPTAFMRLIKVLPVPDPEPVSYHEVSICSNRPSVVDICDPGHYDNQCTSQQGSGLTLSANVTGGSGSFTYAWVAMDPNTGATTNLGNTATITVSDYSSNTIYTCVVIDTTEPEMIRFDQFEIKPFKSNLDCNP